MCRPKITSLDYITAVIARKGCVIDGRAICREELHPKSSSGYFVCRERNAYYRFVFGVFVTKDYI